MISLILPTDDHVALKLRISGKPALLAELARRAAALTGLPEAPITAALAAREALGSTGFGRGVALPHARIDGLDHVFVLFARLDRPINYDAIDARPVDLVVLVLSPRGAHGDHLTVLAALSRRLRDPDVADRLRTAEAQTARHLLVEST